MFKILDLTKKNILAFKAEGKIEEADYEKIIPLLEKTEKEYGPVHLYIEIGAIKGITGKALLKDISTYFRHIRNIRKVAVTGVDSLGKTWVEVAAPFIRGDVKYFPQEEKDIAVEWIKR